MLQCSHVPLIIGLLDCLILGLTAGSLAFSSGPATILTISPSQGFIAGGDLVTLTGSGFSGTTLTLDGNTITPTSASDTQITFLTPARNNGIASVQLSGNGPNAYAEFLYLPPALESLPPGYITTVMGIGLFQGDGRQATQAVLSAMYVATSPDGTVYFSNNSTIRRVRPDGIIERYAGTGLGLSGGPFGDGGPATQATLENPRGLTLDTAGNLFFADFQSGGVRRVDAITGIITTAAGGPTLGYSGDGGPASQAQLNYPVDVAFDGAGNLYILECGDFALCNQPRIRKVDTQGIINTIAGSGAAGFSGDGGPALSATFNMGRDGASIAVDAAGNIYVADSNNWRVRRIDARTGMISTIFASVAPVLSVTVDVSGFVYVGMNNCCSTPALYKLTASGQIVQTWGNGSGFSDDGAAAANAPLCPVAAIALDSGGNILFLEGCSNRIRRIDLSTGLLGTVAGMGPHIIGETGPALATVHDGGDLLFLPTGELLTTEAAYYLVRKMDLAGNVSVFAGNGFLFWNGVPENIPALQASVFAVGLALAPNGDILVAGGDNQAVFRIDGSGIIHAVTGNVPAGFGGDGGPVGSAALDNPWDVAVDSAGNLYIADSNNNRIRRVDVQTGIITTVAGSGPVNGSGNYNGGSYCGDGGPAIAACLNTPYGIAVAIDGTLYIGEHFQRLRKVDPGGTITTFFNGQGQKVRFGPGGNLFMTPYRIEPNGHAYQFAFTAPAQPGLGDGGPASAATYGGELQAPGIAVDAEGNLFFYDAGNLRIRAIRYGAVIAEPGSAVAATGGTPQAVPAGTAFLPLEITLTSPTGTLENGIRVDFAAPSSGASCALPGGGSTFSTLTGMDGRATAVCTANSLAGSYAVKATPLNLGNSATFSLLNGGAPASLTISGTSQSAPANTRFQNPLQVIVKDAAGNLLSGQRVTFSAPPSGASAVLSSSSVITDATGVATVTATANWTVGSYSILASVNGIPGPVSFALTNSFSPCDLNQSGAVDLTDLRTILGEALGTADPIHDLRHDGAVNVVDVQIVLNVLLGLGCSAI